MDEFPSQESRAVDLSGVQIQELRAGEEKVDEISVRRRGLQKIFYNIQKLTDTIRRSGDQIRAFCEISVHVGARIKKEGERDDFPVCQLWFSEGRLGIWLGWAPTRQ